MNRLGFQDGLTGRSPRCCRYFQVFRRRLRIHNLWLPHWVRGVLDWASRAPLHLSGAGKANAHLQLLMRAQLQDNRLRKQRTRSTAWLKPMESQGDTSCCQAVE